MADQKTILYALEIKGIQDQLDNLKALNKQVEELKNGIIPIRQSNSDWLANTSMHACCVNEF